MKFWLKACPKCGGDLKLQPDIAGEYVECVQCGLELSPVQERVFRRLGRAPADPLGAILPVGSGSPHHQVA